MSGLQWLFLPLLQPVEVGSPKEIDRGEPAGRKMTSAVGSRLVPARQNGETWRDTVRGCL